MLGVSEKRQAVGLIYHFWGSIESQIVRGSKKWGPGRGREGYVGNVLTVGRGGGVASVTRRIGRRVPRSDKVPLLRLTCVTIWWFTTFEAHLSHKLLGVYVRTRSRCRVDSLMWVVRCGAFLLICHFWDTLESHIIGGSKKRQPEVNNCSRRSSRQEICQVWLVFGIIWFWGQKFVWLSCVGSFLMTNNRKKGASPFSVRNRSCWIDGISVFLSRHSIDHHNHAWTEAISENI